MNFCAKLSSIPGKECVFFRDVIWETLLLQMENMKVSFVKCHMCRRYTSYMCICAADKEYDETNLCSCGAA